MEAQDRLIKLSFIKADAHQLRNADVNKIYKLMKTALSPQTESVAGVPCSALLDPAHVAKAIDDEPECPGEMPDEMWQALKVMGETNDRAGMTEAIRLTVRLTKEGIKERLGV